MKKSEIDKIVRNAEIIQLSNVFEKYDFFNDYHEISESYGVLLDIFSALSQDTKDKIYDLHNMRK